MCFTTCLHYVYVYLKYQTIFLLHQIALLLYFLIYFCILRCLVNILNSNVRCVDSILIWVHAKEFRSTGPAVLVWEGFFEDSKEGPTKYNYFVEIFSKLKRNVKKSEKWLLSPLGGSSSWLYYIIFSFTTYTKIHLQFRQFYCF